LSVTATAKYDSFLTCIRPQIWQQGPAHLFGRAESATTLHGSVEVLVPLTVARTNLGKLRQGYGAAILTKIVTDFHFKVCAKVCADGNGRLGVARKLLKILVPASRFELLTPRV
jgi:hypothetical protein